MISEKRAHKNSPGTPDKTVELLERLVGVNQDLFILEALRAGAKGETLREFLHVNQWRVTSISKLLKNRVE